MFRNIPPVVTSSPSVSVSNAQETDYHTYLLESSQLSTELQTLGLVETALSCGANRDHLIAHLNVDGELTALLGVDPLVLSLEELQEKLSEEKEQGKKVFWTKRKKFLLAAAAAVSATMAAAILLSKKPLPEKVTGIDTASQPLVRTSPTSEVSVPRAPTPKPTPAKTPGTPAPKPAPEPKPHVPGTGISPIDGVGRVDHQVKSPLLKPVKTGATRTALPRTPILRSVYSELQVLRERARALGKLSYSDTMSLSDSRVDMNKEWAHYKEIAKTPSDPSRHVSDRLAPTRIREEMQGIADSLESVFDIHGHPEGTVSSKLIDVTGPAFLASQKRLVDEAKHISNEVLSLMKKLHSS